MILSEAEKRSNVTLHFEHRVNAVDLKDAVFTRFGTLARNFTPKLFFSNDELHIILKRMNVKICEHSCFSTIEEKYFYGGVENMII